MAGQAWLACCDWAPAPGGARWGSLRLSVQPASVRMPKRGYAPLERESAARAVEASDAAAVASADSSGLPPLIPKLQRHPTAEAIPAESEGADAEPAGAGPQLGMWKLAALTFFAVSGGPFGIEPLVPLSPPLSLSFSLSLSLSL